MSPQHLRQRILSHLPEAEIVVHDLTGGQDHYEVEVTSNAFEGKTRIQQHRMVMAFFQNELDSGEVHALSLKTRVSGR